MNACPTFAGHRLLRPMILAALLLAGTTGLQAQTLRLRLGADPETLYNVQSISSTVDNVLGTYVLERLVYLDDKGQPQPWLAESWPIASR